MLAPAGALAHHSFAAEYDTKKPVTLKGTVTKVEWTNPHARFYLDVKDESGAVTNWNLELASPNVLIRNGWNRHYAERGRSGDGGRRPSQGRIADGQCQNRHVGRWEEGLCLFGERRSASDPVDSPDQGEHK